MPRVGAAFPTGSSPVIRPMRSGGRAAPAPHHRRNTWAASRWLARDRSGSCGRSRGQTRPPESPSARRRTRLGAIALAHGGKLGTGRRSGCSVPNISTERPAEDTAQPPDSQRVPRALPEARPPQASAGPALASGSEPTPRPGRSSRPKPRPPRCFWTVTGQTGHPSLRSPHVPHSKELVHPQQGDSIHNLRDLQKFSKAKGFACNQPASTRVPAATVLFVVALMLRYRRQRCRRSARHRRRQRRAGMGQALTGAPRRHLPSLPNMRVEMKHQDLGSGSWSLAARMRSRFVWLSAAAWASIA